MAWERNFEARVLKIRNKELKFQKLNFTIEVSWPQTCHAPWHQSNWCTSCRHSGMPFGAFSYGVCCASKLTFLWNNNRNGSPILVTLVSFWHFSVVRQQILTPSIAFTSVRYSRFGVTLWDTDVLCRFQVSHRLAHYTMSILTRPSSIFGNEVCAERPAGNAYQYAPGAMHRSDHIFRLLIQVIKTESCLPPTNWEVYARHRSVYRTSSVSTKSDNSPPVRDCNVATGPFSSWQQDTVSSINAETQIRISRF